MAEIQEHDPTHHQTAPKPPSSPSPPRRKSSFLNFWQLFCLAVMVLLTANGLTSLGDIAFVIFCPVYLYLFISRFAFPRKQSEQKRPISTPSKLFQVYFHSTAVIGLFLPIAYVADGIFRGDIYGARAAAPHLFLVSGQVLFERFGFSDKFSMPIAILGPIFSNTRRNFALLEWMRAEFSETTQQRNSMRVLSGRVLSSVNTAVWFFNLFGLLLPVYLPRACKIYFSDNKAD